jgi:4-alpha-glucanotransferase
MIAQAYHIGRVAMQAHKLHMDAIIPADLPDGFDQQSDQVWTRSRNMWVPREVLGSLVLKAQGRL